MKKFLLVTLAIMMVAVTALVSACATSSVPTMTQAPQTTTQAGIKTPPATTSPAYTRPPMTTTAATTTRPAATTARPTTTQSYPSVSNPTPVISVDGSTVPQPTGANAGTIGLAAGGAKDIGNFRENIRNNYLPQSTDVSYEGLFYDYYFDTGISQPANKLFSPSYSSAVTRDPISNQTEYYLSVGLNSGLQESDFLRKKLNLVIVLDMSGSMGEEYTEYYYDGQQVSPYADEGGYRKTKIQSAEDAIISILDQLKDDDRFAIVSFNERAFLNKPMGRVSQANMQDIKNNVLDIGPGGSTNLAAGLQMAGNEFNSTFEYSIYDYENRIMVLTDAQANTGDFTSNGLMNMVQNNAYNRIYSTFIGVGVDFNSDLINQITQIKGANYYSVRSPREFRNRVDEQFDYMVTPLIFNVNLQFESAGWRIEKVFGSPEADAATGHLMRINTLFASKSDSTGQVKGGLVLLKLRKISSDNASIYLRTTYEDRNGRTDGDSQVISLETTQPEYFDNSGIRKGVLLTRYAALLKNWMIDEANHYQYTQQWTPCIREDTGIVIPIETTQWERQSSPLTVSWGYKNLFQKFSGYFSSEMDALDDSDLGQELDILNRLSRF